MKLRRRARAKTGEQSRRYDGVSKFESVMRGNYVSATGLRSLEVRDNGFHKL
jgi:hypothetical protein